MNHSTRIIILTLGVALLCSGMALAQITLYGENFGTTASTLPTGWTSDAPIATWGTVTSTASAGYPGASGGANLLASNTGGTATYHMVYDNNLSTVGYTGISVIWGARRTSTFTEVITFEWSIDGTTWNAVPFTDVANNSIWALINAGTRLTLPAATEGVANLRFRWTFTQLNNSGNGRMDDFNVTGTAPVADGAGSATLANAIGSGLFNNTDMFPRNAGSQSVAVTITGVSTGTLTSASLDIPSGWTGLNAANVVLSGTGFTGATSSVLGSTVTVSSAALTNVATGTITISALTTPNPTLVTDNGNYAFTVKTAKSGGTLTAIATLPKAYVVIPIANIRDVDANGVPNDLNTNVVVEGVATAGDSVYSKTSLQAFFQDASGGVNLFRSGLPLPKVIEGRDYVVRGTVIQFNGLTEVSPGLGSDIHDNSASTLPSPQIVTISALMANPEAYEGSFIGIQNLSKVSGGWPTTADSNLTMTDGTNNVTLFVDKDTDLRNNPEPGWPRDIQGVFSQFDSTSPYIGTFSTYELVPRRYTDIVPAGTLGALQASVKVFLQGPYNTGTNLMDNTLNTGGILAAHFGAMPIPASAVDSITVEIRDAPTAAGSTIRRFQPAWLLQDGSIRDFADTTKNSVVYTLTTAGNYYIVIWHRNHLAIMSAAAQPLSGTTTLAYDFTTGQSQAYGTNPMVQVSPGIFAMYAGDANASGIVTTSDANGVFGALLASGYNANDINLSGVVSTADANIIFANLLIGSQVGRPVQIGKEIVPTVSRKSTLPPGHVNKQNN